MRPAGTPSIAISPLQSVRRRAGIRLPDIAKLAKTLGRWGIDENVQVVAYDQGNGVYASRVVAAQVAGPYSNVAVLDGGLAGMAWWRICR